MDDTKRLALRVFLSWALPFFGSFLLFKPDPQTNEMVMALDKNTFKNLIAAVASPVFSYFLSLSVKWDDVRSVTRACLAFFLGNVLLDVLVLLPMSKMPFYPDYLVEIGALYAIFVCAQGWFGHTIATSPMPTTNSIISVVLRTPLPTMTSYVAISFMFDEKQEKLIVPEWHFRTFMVLVANLTIGLNLAKALQQVRDLKLWAIPVTALFIVVTMGLDYQMMCPVFHWSFAKYLDERGFRLLSTTGFAVIAMTASKYRRPMEPAGRRD